MLEEIELFPVEVGESMNAVFRTSVRTEKNKRTSRVSNRSRRSS